MDTADEGIREQDGRRDEAVGQRGIAAPGADAGPEDAEAILTLVCFKCGTEYYFSEGSQPEEMTCGKCGNTVFRSYVSSTSEREDGEYEEATGRDLRTDDPEGDALPGDLLDLDRV